MHTTCVNLTDLTVCWNENITNVNHFKKLTKLKAAYSCGISDTGIKDLTFTQAGLETASGPLLRTIFKNHCIEGKYMFQFNKKEICLFEKKIAFSTVKSYTVTNGIAMKNYPLTSVKRYQLIF